MAAPDFEEGMRLRARHRWKAAAAAFARAAAGEPANAEAHFWLAVSLDNRGEEAAAIPAYRRALDLGLAPEASVRHILSKRCARSESTYGYKTSRPTSIRFRL
jgi:Flp pilus assembly protein TadD